MSRLRRGLLDNPVARTVLSAWSWLVLGVVVVLWLPMVAVVRLVTMPFDPGRYAAGWLFRKLAVVHATLTPMWRFRVVGDLPPDPRRPYVLVSNHESFVDILLISHLPWEMKWLSKRAFFRYPAVGWLMRLAGDIPLDRGDRVSSDAALALARKRLGQRVSVMIFPEGTRSATGELAAFKRGAFQLAIEAQVPIVPLAVYGTRTALRKHDWRLGVSDAEVHVLEPVPTEGLTQDDVLDLRDRVRAMIAAELASMVTEIRPT